MNWNWNHRWPCDRGWPRSHKKILTTASEFCVWQDSESQPEIAGTDYCDQRARSRIRKQTDRGHECGIIILHLIYTFIIQNWSAGPWETHPSVHPHTDMDSNTSSEKRQNEMHLVTCLTYPKFGGRNNYSLMCYTCGFDEFNKWWWCEKLVTSKRRHGHLSGLGTISIMFSLSKSFSCLRGLCWDERTQAISATHSLIVLLSPQVKKSYISVYSWPAWPHCSRMKTKSMLNTYRFRSVSQNPYKALHSPPSS